MTAVDDTFEYQTIATALELDPREHPSRIYKTLTLEGLPGILRTQAVFELMA